MKGKFALQALISVLVIASFFIVVCAAPAPAATPQVFKWRFQTHHPDVLLKDFGFQRVADRIKEQSGGRLQITMFPLGSLCPGDQVFNSCKQGMFEMGLSDPGYHKGFMPEAQVGPLPFSLRNMDDCYQLWFYRGLGDFMRESYANNGVRLLGWVFSNHVILCSKKCVTRASDFKGMKIRSPGTRALWYGNLGASTVYIPGDEVYTALSLGTIDGATWGGEANLLSWKWYETAKYIVYPGVNIAQYGNDLYVNPKAFASLPPDLQAILESVATWWCITMAQIEINKNQSAFTEMEKKGVTACKVVQGDYPILTKAAEKIWADLAKQGPRPKKAIQLITNYMKTQGYTDFKVE
jgi:TRAP-type C4-dicarboxylate transport system substrate-binding protein